MNKKFFIMAGSWFGLLAAAAERPNFVFIAVDDLNHYASFLNDQDDNFLRRVYPDDAMRAEVGRRLTPNLQRLADQSLIFRRAYCASPLCGPSRTSLLTGVPAHLSGYYVHDRAFRLYDTLDDVVTLPQYLRANGYYTTGLGKIYHRPTVDVQDGVRNDWPDTDHSWDAWVERNIGTNGPGRTLELSPYSPTAPAENFKFGTTTVDAARTDDWVNARFAADLILHGTATITDVHGKPVTVTLPNDKPYFLACGLFAPHLPWHVPKQYYDRFPTEDMAIDDALVRWANRDVGDLPPAASRFLGHDFDQFMEIGRRIHGDGGMVHAWRAALQAYLATTAYADDCLGQLIDAIERNPASESTVVVLWGDHGWHLGDKRRFRKAALWDPASHTVLLIRDPARATASHGLSTERLVTLQDIYPTLVRRSGLEVPDHVHGRDLAPLLADPGAPWPNQILITFQEGNHAIRTSEWRYIRYHGGDRELYDLVRDPAEETNLAGRPSASALERTADETLNAYLARSASFYRN